VFDVDSILGVVLVSGLASKHPLTRQPFEPDDFVRLYAVASKDPESAKALHAKGIHDEAQFMQYLRSTAVEQREQGLSDSLTQAYDTRYAIVLDKIVFEGFDSSTAEDIVEIFRAIYVLKHRNVDAASSYMSSGIDRRIEELISSGSVDEEHGFPAIQRLERLRAFLHRLRMDLEIPAVVHGAASHMLQPPDLAASSLMNLLLRMIESRLQHGMGVPMVEYGGAAEMDVVDGDQHAAAAGAGGGEPRHHQTQAPSHIFPLHGLSSLASSGVVFVPLEDDDGSESVDSVATDQSAAEDVHASEDVHAAEAHSTVAASPEFSWAYTFVEEWKAKVRSWKDRSTAAAAPEAEATPAVSDEIIRTAVAQSVSVISIAASTSIPELTFVKGLNKAAEVMLGRDIVGGILESNVDLKNRIEAMVWQYVEKAMVVHVMDGRVSTGMAQRMIDDQYLRPELRTDSPAQNAVFYMIEMRIVTSIPSILEGMRDLNTPSYEPTLYNIRKYIQQHHIHNTRSQFWDTIANIVEEFAGNS
jgi:hypothetical protein